MRLLLTRARTSFWAGNAANALAHLEACQRREPSNRIITLIIGDIKLSQHIKSCVEQYQFLLDMTKFRGVRLRLVKAAHQNTEFEVAAQQLDLLLRRSAPVNDPAFFRFASAIARDSGSLGWCGLRKNGQLFFGHTLECADINKLEIFLDGAALKVKKEQLSFPHQNLASVMIPDGLQPGNNITVRFDDRPLIGSNLDLTSLRAVEGFAETNCGETTGWCWYPGDPLVDPLVQLYSSQKTILHSQAKALPDLCKEVSQSLDFHKFFSFPSERSLVTPSEIEVHVDHHNMLLGSPIRPLAAYSSRLQVTRKIASKFPVLTDDKVELSADPCEDSILCEFTDLPPVVAAYTKRPVLVVIPAYKGFQATIDTIKSVRRHSLPTTEILVVLDNSPDRKLVDKLRELHKEKIILLNEQGTNRGFPASANIGLREAARSGRDVVILNSDTIVTEQWLERLQHPFGQDHTIGTTTPLSNAASIFSFPYVEKTNKIPSVPQIDEINMAAFLANANSFVEVPTGHGFCLFIRHDCLLQTGALREDVFGRGYGEENDFCVRARHLGWRHVAVTGCYVGHIEGQSFSESREHLIKSNLKKLNRLHPGYDHTIQKWIAKDPLLRYRQNIIRSLWENHCGGVSSKLLVTHDRTGGVLQFVNSQVAAARANGLAVFILKPFRSNAIKHGCVVEGLLFGETTSLIFDLPKELPLLREFIKITNVRSLEIHSLIGHNPGIFEFIVGGVAPYDVYIHDYSWFCPRITLTDGANRYCGEPPVHQCVKCLRENGSHTGEEIGVLELLERSSILLEKAQAVLVPTNDVRKRFVNRFKISPVLAVWERSREEALRLNPLRTDTSRRRKVCLAGAIGYEKGYKIIYACASLAADLDLPIEFVVVGYTCDDKRLLSIGNVQIIGRYEEAELVNLIKTQSADLAWLPALWPETWSFVLSKFWEAGLPVVAFDIGAPAERIRARDGGFLLPLGLPTERLVNVLLTLVSK